MTQTITAQMPPPVTEDRRWVALEGRDAARLHEAMALLGNVHAEEVLSLALEELVQRQRFLALVHRHEQDDRACEA